MVLPAVQTELALRSKKYEQNWIFTKKKDA